MRSFVRVAVLACVALSALLVLAMSVTWWLLPPLDMARFEQRSPVVLARGGQLLHVALSSDHAYRLQTRVSDVDGKYVEALLALEDKHFWHHPGVNPLALGRAAWQWLSSGQVVSGGSTITMQVARLLEPKPRTVLAKWWEVVRAFQLEWRYSKTEILGLYMTMLPMGGNVESVRAASLRYWGVEPRHLSLSEIALLLAVPQSPETRRPDLRPQASLKAMQGVARKLVDAGVFPASDLSEANQLPFERLHPMPQGVWHLAKVWQRSRTAGESQLQSTIDARLQDTVQRTTSIFGRRLNAEQNVAVMVVDGFTGDVLAHVGSLGLGSKAGFMDLTQATRSPGSTLKPFIYGMGFDDGLLDDQTILEDRAKSFGGYSPSNFDRGFVGPVRAGRALQLSLNVPAVEVMSRLGAETFETAWRDAGLNLVLPKHAEPNLGITLGAVGIDLQALVQAYTALVNGGRAQPLRVDLMAPQAPSRLLLTEATSKLLTSILASAPDIDGRMRRTPARGDALAMKTGTSYGYRDSWAIGTKGAHVIGVWIGRPDGTPEVGQTGRSAALRLARDISDTLPKSDVLTAAWHAKAIGEVQAPPLSFELISPQPGAQLVLTESAHESRTIPLRYSGSLEAIDMRLNGRQLHLSPTGLVPVPDDGFYELELIPAHGPTQRVRFAVLGRT